jgi:hypothetical protein
MAATNKCLAQSNKSRRPTDIVPIELASYGVQLQYERDARASGYPELK